MEIISQSALCKKKGEKNHKTCNYREIHGRSSYSRNRGKNEYIIKHRIIGIYMAGQHIAKTQKWPVSIHLKKVGQQKACWPVSIKHFFAKHQLTLL